MCCTVTVAAVIVSVLRCQLACTQTDRFELVLHCGCAYMVIFIFFPGAGLQLLIYMGQTTCKKSHAAEIVKPAVYLYGLGVI